MSPFLMHSFRASVGFPRVSGDEPAAQRIDRADNKFSPRERG